MRGLYLVTPNWDDTDKLLDITRTALHAGAALVQYRHKEAGPELRLQQAAALLRLCRHYGRPLVINDHIDLCITLDADGVHVGGTDAGVAQARGSTNCLARSSKAPRKRVLEPDAKPYNHFTIRDEGLCPDMSAALSVKRRILVVDDDPILLQFLAEVLGHAGYDTVAASSGEAALKEIAEREPDLALLDITMPGMSGLELAQHLKAHTAVPFMFLSAIGDSESSKQAATYGAVGYVVKPVDAERLMPAFEAGLARADEIRQLRRTETNLNAALAAGRETSLAVGLLMCKFQTDRNTAFEVLRDHARSSRRKINEVADQLLAAEETLNSLHAGFANRLKPK